MPSTLLPFLYQTRTIFRIPPRAPTAFARSLHATCVRPKANNDIPFATDVPGEDVPMEPRGTITPSERQVFERIFADIKARGLKPQAREDAQPAAESSTASRSALLIMQQAAQDARQARPATVTAPSMLAGAAKDRNKALLRFPAELRAAASKALDTIQAQAVGGKSSQDGLFGDETGTVDEDEFVDEGWKAPPHSFGRTIELDAKRHPERMRIEGMIIGAKTDFELWDVLEKEVFTMPAKLGIARSNVETDEALSTESTIAPSSEQATNTEDPHDKDVSAIERLEAAAEVGTVSPIKADTSGSPDPHQTLSLYIHGPLYPAYLLLALRRLNMAFRTPSPLVFSILPRIKELGLKSYVLGVSTPFYNELLRIYWTRRGDLSGMLGLLEEMRHCGLYFDEQTASVMDRVDEAVFTMASLKNKNSFGRALMTMPEYEHSMRNRIRHWRAIIDVSIKQRLADFSY
ncbi:hypothetical protein F5X99DRAFT_106839 [Biscogniauxia marginata]|nr:hypothetical protein F5X99DRAFT_106839 [Biscogniauxia marginata]